MSLAPASQPAEAAAESPAPSPTPPRRDSESSASRSEYGDDPPPVPGASPLRVLSVYHTGHHRNYTLHAGNAQSPIVYYLENSRFTRDTPDVQLRVGSRTGAMAAFAKVKHFSTSVTLGLGEPDAQDAAFEQLERSGGNFSGEHRFEMPAAVYPYNEGRDGRIGQAGGGVSSNGQKGEEQVVSGIPTSANTGAGPRKAYQWKRTHDSSVGGRSAKWNLRHMKCVEEESGKVVATFSNNAVKSWKKKGKFTFFVGEGERWEAMVLVSALVVIEKRRRRARQSAGGGGGGGP